MEKREEKRSTAARSVAKFSITLAAAAFCSASQALTLQDLNSIVQIDPTTAAGVNNWSVDGQNQLSQQWFWYRVGNNAETPINSISAPVVSTSNGTRGVTTTYNNGQFSVQVDYLLTGGTAGSGQSDLAETVRIVNNSGSALDFHFFSYADFDLNGSLGGDAVNLTTIGGKYFLVDQVEGALALAETVNTPAANHGEAALFNATLTKLNNGVADNLNDNTAAGPGDATWALQWDVLIQNGGSFLISSDKRIQLSAVPEPTTVALLGVGIAGLLIRRKLKS